MLDDDGDVPQRPHDDDTDLGDTPEAHDEISPHDLPPGHPGRGEAERQAAENEDEESGEKGTTQGDPELSESAPARSEDDDPSDS